MTHHVDDGAVRIGHEESSDAPRFVREWIRDVESTRDRTRMNVVNICDFHAYLGKNSIGLLHGGVMASFVDVACGYAALSVMPADREVLTVEFKINFIRPANTDRLIAVGQVLKAGYKKRKWAWLSSCSE